MKTVQDIILYVSTQLQDQRPRQQYTRWSKATLISYLNDALSEILGIRPEAFALRTTVTLDPGYIQAVPATCSAIVRVDSNPDGSMVYEADTELMRAFGSIPANRVPLRYDVNGNVLFNVRSWSMDPKDPKTYYVSPPVPTGVTCTVLVTMVFNPPVFDVTSIAEDVDVNPVVYNLVQDYMLGRAFEIDVESAESRANSVKHFTQFYQFFGLQYKQTGTFRSGAYLGSTPAGNSAGAST